MEHVIIGVDPHKLSTTIEVVVDHEQVLGHGRFTADAQHDVQHDAQHDVQRDAQRTPGRTQARVREGTAGRLVNPARSTYPRTSTLRISHFPDPRPRRNARPVDNRREPVRRTSLGVRHPREVAVVLWLFQHLVRWS